VVELEYVMVKTIGHKTPNVRAEWKKAKLFDSRVIRVSIDERYLIPLNAAVTSVVGRYAGCAITAVHDAGVLHHDVFGGLEVDVSTSEY